MLLVSVSEGCVTKKKRNETSKLGKFYHNTTSLYNGYWNAKEIYRLSKLQLQAANEDDYNKILEVEDYISVNDPKMVKDDMDIIIQKVTTVAQLHEPGDYVDDCYVMLAKAQYLKHEFETSEETLEYFQEEFNPTNPYGRNYMSKKPTGKAAIKQKALEREQQAKAKEEEREIKIEQRKEEAKTKEEERKEKIKQRERDKKEREKQRKEAIKNRKKGIKTPPPTTTKQTPVTKVEEKEEVKQTNVSSKVESESEEIIPTPKIPDIDRSAYPEGLLWLAKTYIKRQNYFGSDVILRKLDVAGIEEDFHADIHATQASLYIKQEKYSDAVAKLKLAIAAEDDKNLKGRYAFIAGQLSQQLKDYATAYTYFEQANKYTKSDKMAFMSELAIAKSAILSGAKTQEEIATEMQKFLKNDRYTAYHDQIYFTLAEMELAQNNEPKAIEYLKLSAKNNVNNSKLKVETYYTIANLYYNAEKYLFAANYFDTTLTNLNVNDPRQLEVKKTVESLKDIAYNINVIEYQDTMLYFSNLDENAQKKAIVAWLKRNNPNLSHVDATVKTNNSSKQPESISIASASASNFFAYNVKGRDKGISDFKSIWGDRPLEDDWRRSRKATSSDVVENVAIATPKVDEATGEENSQLNDEYKKILRDVPNNPVKKQELNEKIVSAMFTLGKLYRDKIEKFALSANTLEKMHKRFGPTQYEIESHYYIFLDYMDLNDPATANLYKEKIIKKYPDSKYAATLSDPNYFVKNKEKTPEAFYQSLYDLYEKREFAKVLKGIKENRESIEHSPFSSKIALLNAMCIGSVDGKDAYLAALKEVTQSYPNTPEQAKAREIMRYLAGDNSIFNSVDIKDVDKIYSKDEAQQHYVAVVTYAIAETEQVNIKVAISEYNKNNFKAERLQLGDATLNVQENVQIILIKKFENLAKSMDYYKKVAANIPEFSGRNDIQIDILPISVTNYRKMLSENSTLKYRAFFEAYYKTE